MHKFNMRNTIKTNDYNTLSLGYYHDDSCLSKNRFILKVHALFLCRVEHGGLFVGLALGHPRDALLLTRDVEGRPFTSNPRVHAVRKAGARGVTNVAWDAVGTRALVRLVVTCRITCFR